ncbi:MAG TPA: DNA topoisomerase (ATP-hydrolyzing) subunit A, partial [Phormidium sp.]
MRVVIELKRDTKPQEVLENLYRQTALSSNFGAILLALVEGQPRQLSLRQILQEFLSFREQTLTRQYSHELEQTERRLHLVEGLIAALENLDAIIEILRNAPDGSTAKVTFQSQFNFSDRQCDAILAMPLRRLTGLERQQLQQELTELTERIQDLQRLLSDRNELLKALKKDLRTLKKKYSDPRRTRIHNIKATATKTKKTSENENRVPRERRRDKPKTEDAEGQLSLFTPLTSSTAEEANLEITHKGYIRRLSKNGSKSNLKSSDDFVVKAFSTTTQADLIVVTGSGKGFPVKVGEIPPTSGQSKGTPLVSLLPQAKEIPETLAGYFIAPEAEDSGTVVVVSQQGKIKRLAISEFANLTRRGLTVLKLKEDDQLLYALPIREREEIALATTGGRILRFLLNEQQLPVMSRGAGGLQALRLGRNEQLIGAVNLNKDDNLLLVTQLGYAKRLPISAIRLANLGDIGTQALQYTSKSDALISMIEAIAETKALLLTDTPRMVNLSVERIPFWGKDGTGDRINKLKEQEKVVNLVIVEN